MAEGLLPRAYIIASTPRCGSYWLSEMLWNTQRCGCPSEYFSRQDSFVWRDVYGLADYDDYLDFFLRRGWSRNKVFGAKLMYGQLLSLARDLARHPGLDERCAHEALQNGFADLRYIRLRRRDRVRQALSWYRASLTDLWHQDRPRIESGLTVGDLNCEQVDAIEAEIAAGEARWSSFFEINALRPLVVYYEDLVADPRKTLVAVLKHVDVDWTGLQHVEGRMRRQSDGLTEHWLEVLRARERAH